LTLCPDRSRCTSLNSPHQRVEERNTAGIKTIARQADAEEESNKRTTRQKADREANKKENGDFLLIATPVFITFVPTLRSTRQTARV